MTAGVKTLDLDFQGLPGAIASYLVPHGGGVVLVEAGPGSTIETLQARLAREGYEVADVTDVLLTHIHLDHAGAAGWIARQGARIHVHPRGAPHLIDPEKLITSAARIYGEMMDTLWGEFLAVPEHQLSIPADGDVIEIGALRFHVIETPGHANHHYSYILDDVAFTGDVTGVRLGGLKHLRLPMPPPEFNLELWRSSLRRLRREFENAGIRYIAPTHFGVHDDPDWHLSAVESALDEVEEWMERVLPGDPPIEQLRADFTEWTREINRRNGFDVEKYPAQQVVNKPAMSADGIQRYWRKHRAGTSGS